MAQTNRKKRAAAEADAADTHAPKAKADPNAAVIDVAMKRWRRSDEASRDQREKAYDDLTFLEPGGQWDATIKAAREEQGRPCLEFDHLSPTIAQITGDIRQMRPALKASGIDDRADPKTAEMLAGLCRYVENRSDAASTYFAGADQQVAAGIGAWKVITEYGSDTTFDLEIAVAPIPDGIGVRWDPDAIKPTREDGKFVFVPIDMSREVYEESYPDHPCAEISSSDTTRPGLDTWSTSDTVRIAEYYTKTEVQKTLALMPDGEIIDLTEGDEEKLALVEQAKQAGAPVRVEKRPGHKIERYLITANDVLEGPDLIPGSMIPVVPLLGVEQFIGKKRTLRGVVRKARDAMCAYNYARSTETEVVALQPKAPFTGTEVMFKGYEHIWDTANTENHPYLPYNADPKAPGGKPERVAPPVPSAGLAALSQKAADDIKAVTGIYAASLGAPSNETSGKAIKARQQEGDTGSFIYISNFGRAVRHTGRIILGMIPHVYDTARTLRIVGEDGKEDLVKINQPQGLADDGEAIERLENDVTVGAYDVAFEMGPSYTTKREAAADGITAFVQAAPQAAPLVLDLLAKAQDWPMADKIAKRIRTMLPPQVQAEEAQEAGEAPPPPNPQQMAEQAAQQRQQQLAEAQHQLDGQKLQVEQQKIQAEVMKIQSEIQKAALDHQSRGAEAKRPAEGSAPGAADPRIDAIANGLQDLAHLVSMIMETLGGGDGAPAPDGPADPEAGPPGPIDMPPGAMPGPTSEAPPGAFSFDPSAMGQPAAPMMGAP